MLTPDDLLAPKGVLTPSLFPDDDEGALSERLTEYLADAATRVAAAGVTDEDAADDYARAWGYARAFGARYLQMTNDPATIAKGDRSTSYVIAQMENMGKLAAQWEAAAAAVLAGAVAALLTLPAAPPPRVTRAALTEYAW